MQKIGMHWLQFSARKRSSDYLDLLTLMVIHGFKQADIARDMDCSRSSISQKIKRIKKILQNKK